MWCAPPPSPRSADREWASRARSDSSVFHVGRGRALVVRHLVRRVGRLRASKAKRAKKKAESERRENEGNNIRATDGPTGV